MKLSFLWKLNPMKIDETTVIWTWTVLCPSQWHPNLFTEVINKQTCTLETLNYWIAYIMEGFTMYVEINTKNYSNIVKFNRLYIYIYQYKNIHVKQFNEKRWKFYLHLYESFNSFTKYIDHYSLYSRSF